MSQPRFSPSATASSRPSLTFAGRLRVAIKETSKGKGSLSLPYSLVRARETRNATAGLPDKPERREGPFCIPVFWYGTMEKSLSLPPGVMFRAQPLAISRSLPKLLRPISPFTFGREKELDRHLRMMIGICGKWEEKDSFSWDENALSSSSSFRFCGSFSPFPFHSISPEDLFVKGQVKLTLDVFFSASRTISLSLYCANIFHDSLSSADIGLFSLGISSDETFSSPGGHCASKCGLIPPSPRILEAFSLTFFCRSNPIPASIIAFSPGEKEEAKRPFKIHCDLLTISAWPECTKLNCNVRKFVPALGERDQSAFSSQGCFLF